MDFQVLFVDKEIGPRKHDQVGLADLLSRSHDVKLNKSKTLPPN